MITGEVSKQLKKEIVTLVELEATGVESTPKSLFCVNVLLCSYVQYQILTHGQFFCVIVGLPTEIKGLLDSDICNEDNARHSKTTHLSCVVPHDNVCLVQY